MMRTKRQKISSYWLIVHFSMIFFVLPSLSPTKRLIVDYLPWFVLIFGIVKVFRIISLLSPYLWGNESIWYAVDVAVGILLLFAFPRLIKKKKADDMFWAVLLSTVELLVANTFEGIVIAVILFYILFQIRQYYTKLVFFV